MLRTQAKLVLGLLVLAAIASIAPATTNAQTLDPNAATHLGKKTSEWVSLSGLFNNSGEIFFLRTLPDGKAESFTIPKGKVLVITDIHWQITAGNPGTVCRLSLNVENVANPVAFTRRVYNSVLTLNTAGVNGSNDRLTAGILVSWEGRIKATTTIPTGALEHLLLIGYLVDEA
jgi:hypothetical protein